MFYARTSTPREWIKCHEGMDRMSLGMICIEFFILLQGRKGMHYIIHKSNLIDALSLDEQVK